MSIGDNIKRIRTSHGLSQAELGKIAGVSDKAVSTWESDIKVPRMGAVERISQYFGIPKSAILDDSTIPAGFEPLPATDTVPLVGRIACGEPITAEENLEGYVAIPSAWHATFTLHCCGDSMELQDVRPVHVRAVMASVADRSESLQHKVLITMRQLFETARQNGLIQRDPTEGLKTTPHAAPDRQKYLSPPQVAELLQALTEPRARAFVGLCLYCGLRKEEALGLQWGDISAGRLVVARAMTFGSNQQLPTQELKTKASCRMLPVPDALKEILDQVPRLSVYVVPGAGGAPMSRSAFTSLWRRHVLACVDFEVRPHMLRHTYATMLYRAGVPLRTAQYLMGHSSITMTAQIYTHLEAEDGLQVADQLNGYLQGIGVG